MVTQTLQRLVLKHDLSRAEAASLMEGLMQGEATDAQIGGLLVALRMKGETVSEVAGFAETMRAHAVPVRPQRTPLLDTCGTGGGSFKVFNVSTGAAFVAAAAGVAVAKHGNRAASGICGSADVLEALGVRVDISPELCAECIDELGIGFLFARSHHPAMKHVSVARREIGVRSVFNLLGPLTNPAGASLQVMGVYDGALCPLVVGALKELGSTRALVIHSEPGFDELSTFSMGRICELRDGIITDRTVTPLDLGVEGPSPDVTVFAPAQNPSDNADILRQSLGYGPATETATARRALVALNASAALIVAGLADDWIDASRRAWEIISAGTALTIVEKLAALTSAGRRV